ncbi:MAG: hypothetical protein ABSF72_05920 [Candidatus Sulfotelmatobacter sp.]
MPSITTLAAITVGCGEAGVCAGDWLACCAQEVALAEIRAAIDANVKARVPAGMLLHLIPRQITTATQRQRSGECYVLAAPRAEEDDSAAKELGAHPAAAEEFLSGVSS